MACCSYKKTPLINQPSVEETEPDETSKLSTEPAESVNDPKDPDALSTFQVITAIVFLCLFALSFATSFCLLGVAVTSLQANFTDQNYTCKIFDITATALKCPGSGENATCINVQLKCDGFKNETKTLYEYYQDYYDTKCSATRCVDPDKVYENEVTKEKRKFPLSLVQRCCIANKTKNGKLLRTPYDPAVGESDLYDDLPFIDVDTFRHDLNKPEAMFFKTMDNSSTSGLLLSQPVAYIVIVVPLTTMVLIFVVISTLCAFNKLSAKHVRRARATDITPLHKEVNGKWYIKEDIPEVAMNAFEKLKAGQSS